jgi:DNA-binding GntR family transcriptional regulator
MFVRAIHQQRAQLRDEAAAYLRDLVLSGQARPGALVRLGPVAAQLEMSLTPVREALLLLAQAGWVIQEPNKGFRVARFEERDILDSYFVNRTLAGELAARASAVIDPETVSALEAVDARIQSATNREDAIAVQRWNTEIHRTIYEAADAPRLRFFVEAASLFVPRDFWGEIPGWLELNRRAHGKIIEALAAHDADASRSLMELHIDAAGRLLVDYLIGRDFFVPDAVIAEQAIAAG